MSTILTDDERRQAIQSIVLTSPGTADQIARAVEAAVLAKLAQQADRQRVPEGMSEINRTIAYCAAHKLRELGFQWDETASDWLAAPEAPAQAEEISPEFTDTARAALLWVLWHHQGGSSDVGQPIRFALGMGQYEKMNAHQVREAKRWAALNPKPTHEAPAQVDRQRVPDGWKLVPVEPTDEMVDAACDKSDFFRVDFVRAWDAAIKASPELTQSATSHTHKVVPVTPTKEMLISGARAPVELLSPDGALQVYRAMLAAAPEAPAQASAVDERAVDERAAFEAWYSQNAFNFERDPIGSRECGLQWKAWQARAALAQKGGAA